MNRTPYHKIYGFMPKSVIEHMSNNDKTKMITEAIFRPATPAGCVIMTATVFALGKDFIDYIINGIVNSLVDEVGNFTEEDVMSDVKDIFDEFAKDPNYMMEFITDYADVTGNDLGFDPKWLNEFVTPPEEKKEETYTRDAKGRLRNSKGHFVKE